MEDKEKLTDEDLRLVSGGVDQGTEEETDEPVGLSPTQACFEKWVRQ